MGLDSKHKEERNVFDSMIEGSAVGIKGIGDILIPVGLVSINVDGKDV